MMFFQKLCDIEHCTKYRLKFEHLVWIGTFTQRVDYYYFFEHQGDKNSAVRRYVPWQVEEVTGEMSFTSHNLAALGSRV